MVGCKTGDKLRGGQVDGGSQRQNGANRLPTGPPPHHILHRLHSPQTRVAFGRLAKEVVEQVPGVEVAQHGCRM